MDVELGKKIAELIRQGQGFHIIPDKDKRPILKDWPKLASNNISEVLTYFAECPAANQVGIACGLSNIIVIDVDMPSGPDTVANLIKTHGPLQPTLTQTTPSGGKHFVYRAVEGLKIGNSKNLGLKVDVRGEGGQIVYYGWDNPRTEIAFCNSLWIKRMQSTKYGLAALDGETEKILALPPDSKRNDQLNEAGFKLGKRIYEGLLDEKYVREVLYITGISAGLEEDETRNTIQSSVSSGIEAGKNESRSPSTISHGSTLSEVFDDNFVIMSYDEVPDEIVEWYEEGWIPKKGLLGMVGRTKEGKTTAVMGMMAFLANEHEIEILYLATEGSQSRLKSQMRIHNIDPKKVRTILRKQQSNEERLRRRFAITESMVHELLRRFPNTKAIVVDPAVDFFDVDDAKNSSKEIRDKLEDFDHLADQMNILLIFIKHQKKEQVGTQSLSQLDKIHGSGAWAEVPRICHCVFKLDDKLRGDDDLLQDPATHLMKNLTNSNYKLMGAKVLQMDEMFDEPTHSMVQYFKTLGVKETLSDADIIEAAVETRQQSEERISKTERQREWLFDYLLDHDARGVDSKEVIKEAKKVLGVSQPTMYRRRDELIKDGRMENTNDGMWRVPDKLRANSRPSI